MVHLTNEGEDVEIASGAQAYFRFKKPDGKVVVNTADIVDNAIRVVLTSQILAVAGRGYGDIVLQDGQGNISTVSFILIIMASPQISNEVESSNEFTYLNAVVSDATNTIYEAEAWAAGTRGGAAVPSTSDFSVEPSGVAIATASAAPSTFINVVGEEPGVTRTFTFTYIEGTNWWKECSSVNGVSTTVADKELINNIGDYGITYTPAIIDADDQIIVKVQEPDPAHENNAKYYSEAAAASAAYIQTLPIVKYEAQSLSSAEQAIARENINAQVAGDYIADPSTKSEGQFLIYGADGWAASTVDYIANPSEKSEGQVLAYGSDGWAASTLPDYVTEPENKSEGQVLTYSSSGWVAATISAANVNAIPSILTSDFYGTTPPSNPEAGRIFFLYSGNT